MLEVQGHKYVHCLKTTYTGELKRVGMKIHNFLFVFVRLAFLVKRW